MRVLVFATSLLLGLLGVGSPTAAQTTSSDILTYVLEPGSAFETGCFSICDCAIISRPLKGTFQLQQTDVDPLFTHYRVSNVRWVVSDASAHITFDGSGTYKVGGEFAVQHQLVMDLSQDGGPPRHFDSGLVFGGGEFPRIFADISLHQNAACIDTVFHVDATDPIATGVASGPGGSAPSRLRAAPNPFRLETELRLVVRQPGEAEIVIVDVRGRAVRHLRTGTVSPGLNILHWDGRRDGGSLCPAGVYYMTARAGSERMMSRIVKLD